MAMRSEQFEDIDREVWDEETGEISADSVPVEELPKIMRTMRAIQRRRTMLEQYEAHEVERVKTAVQAKIGPMAEYFDHLNAVAEALLRRSGQMNAKTGRPKIEYPGIGTVRIDLTRERVDTAGWDLLTTEEKQHVWNTRRIEIDATITYKPDKAKVKAALQKGDEVLDKLFAIGGGEEQFIVKLDD